MTPYRDQAPGAPEPPARRDPVTRLVEGVLEGALRELRDKWRSTLAIGMFRGRITDLRWSMLGALERRWPQFRWDCWPALTSDNERFSAKRKWAGAVEYLTFSLEGETMQASVSFIALGGRLLHLADAALREEGWI